MLDALSEWKTAILNSKLKEFASRIRVFFPKKQPLFADPYVIALLPDVRKSLAEILLITSKGDFKKNAHNRKSFYRLEELADITSPDIPERLEQIDAFYNIILSLGEPPPEEARETLLYQKRLEQKMKQAKVTVPNFAEIIFGRYPWLIDLRS